VLFSLQPSFDHFHPEPRAALMAEEGAEPASNSLSNGDARSNGVDAPETDAAEPMQEEAPAWDSRQDLPAMSSYQLLHKLTGHAGAIASVKFSKMGGLLASASADKTAKIWDAQSGQLLRTLKGHAKVSRCGLKVHSVIFEGFSP
jgi:WD40 repeat protein